MTEKTIKDIEDESPGPVRIRTVNDGQYVLSVRPISMGGSDLSSSIEHELAEAWKAANMKEQ